MTGRLFRLRLRHLLRLVGKPHQIAGFLDEDFLLSDSLLRGSHTSCFGDTQVLRGVGVALCAVTSELDGA